MLDHWENRATASREIEELPYDPQDWNRRLSEARAKRAAVLRERRAGRPAGLRTTVLVGEQSEDPARIARAVMRIPEPPEATLPVAEEAAKPSRRTLQSSTLLFVTGCVIGSSLTALALAMLSAVWWQDAETPATRLALAAPPAPPLLAAAAETEVDQPATFAASQPVPGTPRPPVAKPLTPAGLFMPSAGDLTAPHDPANSLPLAMAGSGPIPSFAVAVRNPAIEDAPATASSPREADVAALQADLSAPGTVAAAPDTAPADTLPAPIDRVVVLAPRSVSSAGREEVAALLRDAGWPARDPATSPFTISQTHVRYYHTEDRRAAEELATLFEAQARDFTSYSPRPPSGSIELWLAGRAPSRARNPNGPSLPAFLNRLAAILEGHG